MRKADPLSPRTTRILDLLIANRPGFVPGKQLAAAGDCSINALSYEMVKIRRAHPDLAIISLRGSGYRIVSGGLSETPAEPSADKAVSIATIAPDKPGGLAIPLHRRMAANLAILDLLPAKTAEMVKQAAMDACEDIDATLHRLISYGVEVHTDLVVHGENPVGLRRPKAGLRAEQVLQ